MYNIHHDLFINKSPSSIFDAISQPSHLENWWPLKCSGKPEVGATYNFFFEEPYDWFGEVVKCEKNISFHIKMTQSDADWDPTTFGFDLEKMENGTMVHFWHKGWPECNHHFKRSSYCWAILLRGLKNYLEKGVILPFEERS